MTVSFHGFLGWGFAWNSLWCDDDNLDIGPWSSTMERATYWAPSTGVWVLVLIHSCCIVWRPSLPRVLLTLGKTRVSILRLSYSSREEQGLENWQYLCKVSEWNVRAMIKFIHTCALHSVMKAPGHTEACLCALPWSRAPRFPILCGCWGDPGW